MISIGAAALPYRDESSDLAKCGSLKLIVGKHDQYNKREANKYADNLKARHANVELIEFDGAHEIPEQVLLDNLKSE